MDISTENGKVIQVWRKPLNNNKFAVFIINNNNAGNNNKISFNLTKVGGLQNKQYVVTDVWTGEKQDVVNNGLMTVSVNGHGSQLYYFTPVSDVDVEIM